ncbi:hypothetical protein [Methylobacterium sp. WSM2598]|uniref:hypothetical protein n=1 Tax=Methylobacterium sp. WSM2598 TaxID=398261 RepID=UPI0012F67807|nr:hypothetical protein [Methylobacterium sp. WSM2598]
MPTDKAEIIANDHNEIDAITDEELEIAAGGTSHKTSANMKSVDSQADFLKITISNSMISGY